MMFRTASERASERLSVHGVGGLLHGSAWLGGKERSSCFWPAGCCMCTGIRVGIYRYVPGGKRSSGIWKCGCISMRLCIQNSIFIDTGFLHLGEVYVGLVSSFVA